MQIIRTSQSVKPCKSPMNMGREKQNGRHTLTGRFSCNGETMRHPTLRYGHPAELLFYMRGMSEKDLAKTLHRSEKTIKNYLSGREKIPFWVPELLRLREFEYQQRMHEMGITRDFIKRQRPVAVVIDLEEARRNRKQPMRSPQREAMARIARQNRVTESPYFKI